MVDLIEKTLTTLSQGPFPFLAYAVVWFIIFAESGLFFGFFLPGDSLLVTCGALAALPTSPFNIWVLLPLLAFAAVLGDNVGYWFGKKTGPHIFSRAESRFFKPKYLKQAHAFYEKNGGKTILMARFVPIVRTFTPFVAGMGAMDYGRFIGYSVVATLLWVGLILPAGYFFGNMPTVKKHFELVVIGIIFVSCLPMLIELWRAKRATKA